MQNFSFNINIPILTTNQQYASTYVLTGSYTILAFEKELQAMFNVAFNEVLRKMVEDIKDRIVKKLKAVENCSKI
jgi:hypothetical protein